MSAKSLKNITHHPSLKQAEDIKTLCAPLKQLNIDYFSHTRVNKDGHFFGISSNPAFSQHYLERKYYNADIHLAKKKQFGQFVIWDTIERVGLSKKMHSEAAQFGVKHTFTIIEKNDDFTDCFHFAADVNDQTINQVYLNQLDTLTAFTHYFREQTKGSPDLLPYLTFSFQVDENAPGYTIHEPHFLATSNHAPLQAKQFFALKETEVSILKWLHLGKTLEQISEIMGLAPVTIHKHIAQLKIKTGCFTQFQLGEFYSRFF